MSVDSYLAALKSMRAAPDARKAAALFKQLRADPNLARAARPTLVRDPELGAAFRVFQPGADFEHNTVRMPMPRAVKRPNNLDSLMRTVQDAGTQFRALKAMGDGWGFSNAVHTPDWLVHCFDLKDFLPLEDDLFKAGVKNPSELVRFQSGVTFGELNAHLAQQGRTVLNQPGFQKLTYVGVAHVGGHGSGLSLPGISSQIEAIEYVTLNEQNQVRFLRIEPSAGLVDQAKWRQRYPPPTFDVVQDDELFHAARCGMGCLGVVYAVVVRTQPAFNLKETRTKKTWQEARSLIHTFVADPKIHSVHVWLNPYKTGRNKNSVIITVLERTTKKPQGSRGLGIVAGGMNPFTELARIYGTLNPAALPSLIDTALELCVARDVIMPSTEALDFGAPNTLPVHAASMGVNADDIDAIVDDLTTQFADWRAANQWVSSPVGIRWVRASEDFMSPQFGRDTVMIEVPVLKGTPNAVETLERYATYMMDIWGARPHWGQINPMNRQRYEAVYGPTAVRAFATAFRVMNPQGFFDSPFTRQLGLRQIATGL